MLPKLLKLPAAAPRGAAICLSLAAPTVCCCCCCCLCHCCCCTCLLPPACPTPAPAACWSAAGPWCAVSSWASCSNCAAMAGWLQYSLVAAVSLRHDSGLMSSSSIAQRASMGLNLHAQKHDASTWVLQCMSVRCMCKGAEQVAVVTAVCCASLMPQYRCTACALHKT